MFETEKTVAKSNVGYNRRAEAIGSDVLETAIKKLNIPLHTSEYAKGRNQELIFSYEDYTVSVTYSDVSQTEAAVITAYRTQVAGGVLEDIPELRTENWKRLNQITVKSTNGEVKDMLESVPDTYPIFFCPAYTSLKPKGSIRTGEIQGIFFTGDIATLTGIATLAHEIGHLHNEALKPEQERIRTTFHRDQELATKILRERYANAFAYKKLRSFVTNPTDRKNISIYLRHYGQGSYDELLTKVHNARNNKEMSDFYAVLQEMMEPYDYGHGVWEDESNDKNEEE